MSETEVEVIETSDWNAIVKKSNDFIDRAKYDLTVVELRLILVALGKIQVKDVDFETYTIPVSDLMQMTGRSDTMYTEMKGAAQSLMRKAFTVETVNERGKRVQTTLAWFSSIQYVQGSGSIQVRFDPALKPYFLGLKERFTEYNLKYLMPMRSRYSIRIYELLKVRTRFGKRYFDLHEFRSLLQVDQQKGFERYWNLKTRIILPAMREIGKNTDLQVFRCTERKKSGRVIGFTLDFGIKPSARIAALHKQHQRETRSCLGERPPLEN